MTTPTLEPQSPEFLAAREILRFIGHERESMVGIASVIITKHFSDERARMEKLESDIDLLTNFYDRARGLQCSIRLFLESTEPNGIAKAWEHHHLNVHRDYALVTEMLESFPAFCSTRDHLKQHLENVATENNRLRQIEAEHDTLKRERDEARKENAQLTAELDVIKSKNGQKQNIQTES